MLNSTIFCASSYVSGSGTGVALTLAGVPLDLAPEIISIYKSSQGFSKNKPFLFLGVLRVTGGKGVGLS